MSALFYTWSAGVLASLPTLNAPLTTPLGYGLDIACTTDVASDWHTVDPQSVDAIGQALIRRLITPRGALVSDLSYGCGIPQLLNRGIPQGELAGIKRLVEAELQKDDRVATVSAAVTYVVGGELIIDVTVTPESSDKSFSLVVAFDGTGAVVREVVDGNNLQA